MKMKFDYLLITLITAILFTSCEKSEFGGATSPNHKIDGPVFNFSTSPVYTLNLKYNVPEGYIVGFDIYTEYPFESNDAGEKTIKKGLTPVETGFTDKNGNYNNPLTLPAYVSTIYIYTSYAGITPRLLVAHVNNGQLSEATPETVAKTGAVSLQTKGGSSISYNTIESDFYKFTGMNIQTLTLGKWHTAKDGPNPTTLASGEQVKIFGRPTYMSYVNKTKFGNDATGKDALKINAAVLQTINTALLGDNAETPVNPEFLKSGDIKVTKDAELDLIFIQNWGAYRNSLAYYCYETANPPKNIGDIQYQVIAIPNAMEQKTDLNISSMYEIASIYQGEGIKLKYVDKNGVMQDKFPAGTSVGWILYRNGYDWRGQFDSTYGTIGCPTTGIGANFSNPALSDSPNTAVLRHGDFVVIGFDDGDINSKKRDYLDVVFNVQATPSDAITDEVPNVDPEDPKPSTSTNMGMLLYEDLWPYQGDFDLNDVVVKYIAKTTKNKDNATIAAEVSYTIMHSGASQNNSFAFYDPDIANADVTITGGEGASEPATIDHTNNIVRLANNVLNYANNPEKVTFTVNYTYKTPGKYQAAPFNPFITIQSNGESSSGKEVHLTNFAPTAVADKSWFEKETHDWSNPDLGLYYITFEKPSGKTDEDKGYQLPFAVNIVFDSEQNMNLFKITKEGKHINKHYQGFKYWIDSKGKEYKDWYLHYTE